MRSFVLFLSVTLSVLAAEAQGRSIINLVCPTYEDSPLDRVVNLGLRLEHIKAESEKFAECEKVDRSRQSDKYNLCETLRLKFMFERIYTWERVQKLKLIFERIRNISLALLYEKYPDVSVNAYAAKIEKAILQAQVVTDFPETKSRQLDIERINALTFPDRQIHLGGLLLLADMNTRALFQVLAHEMGHIVGPTYTFREIFNERRAPIFPTYDSSYPFHSGLTCIAPRVSSPNYICFEQVAEELAQNGMYRELAQQVLETSARLQDNPYVSVVLSNVAGISCQTGQAEESFADFYGAEVLAKSLKNEFGELQDDAGRRLAIQSSLAFFCSGVLEEEVHPQSGLSRYPSMVNRISNLIFSNADLQRVFVYPDKPIQCRL